METGAENEFLVSGTLHYLENWKEFDPGVSGSGNYLALQYTPTHDPGCALTVMISGGDMKEPIELDPDHVCIFRVKSNTQVITVRGYKSGKVEGDPDFTYTIKLEGLTLDGASHISLVEKPMQYDTDGDGIGDGALKVAHIVTDDDDLEVVVEDGSGGVSRTAFDLDGRHSR